MTGRHERGRRLASEREDLIASGVDPADLVVPLAPDHEVVSDPGLGVPTVRLLAAALAGVLVVLLLLLAPGSLFGVAGLLWTIL